MEANSCAPGTATHGEHDIATLALAPPHPERLEQSRREHVIAVLASLALLDADQHAGAVDIIDLEVRDFRHTQPRAIGDTERSLVFDAGRCFEKLRRFIDTEHVGQLARITRDDERPRQISTPESPRGKRKAETAPLMVEALTPFSC